MTLSDEKPDMSWPMLSPAPRPKDYDWPDSMTKAGVPKGTDPDSYPRLGHRLLGLAIPLGLSSGIMEKHYASSLFKEDVALKSKINKTEAEARWFRKRVFDASGVRKSAEELEYLAAWQNIKEEELEAFKKKRDEVERGVQSVRAKDKARLYR